MIAEAIEPPGVLARSAAEKEPSHDRRLFRLASTRIAQKNEKNPPSKLPDGEPVA